MPQTHECDYCGGDIDPGTGTMLVRTDGTTFRFCSSKCERNHDLGREPRDAEWTAEGRGTARPGSEDDAEPEPEPEPEPAIDEAESDADGEAADGEAADGEAADVTDEDDAEVEE